MKTYIKAFTAVAAVAVVAISLTIPQVFAKESKSVKDNPTLAIVNGTEIKRSEIMDLLGNPENVDLEKIYPQIIDQVINTKIIENAVDKAKLDNDPEVTKRLVDAKKQITTAIYLERVAKKRVTDKLVKKEYDKMKKAQSGIKEMRASHILVKTEAEAKALIKKLDGGADFAKLAKENSTGPTKTRGGDLGYFGEKDMLPAFSKAAFAMKVGTYGKTPVKTQFGWHVIKAEDRRNKKFPALKEVENAIRGKLGQKALTDYIKELRKTASIKRFSFDGKPLN